MKSKLEHPVLIVSSDVDSHTTKPVQDALQKRGFDSVVYSTDGVVSMRDVFVVSIDQVDTNISLNDKDISPKNIAAAWYRKPNTSSVVEDKTDIAKNVYMRLEVNTMHDNIWYLYPDNLWLNPPKKLKTTDSKLEQLAIAQSLGFKIPHTIAGNNWETITQISDENEGIVAKMVRGVIADENILKAMYTTPLSSDLLKQLTKSANPFPGIYQENIYKYREWRVTVVGDNVFSASIYTDDDAKDDWRKLQNTKSVRFKDELLPDHIQERCISYVRKLGLLYGAIDIIEQDKDDFVFLECNPNGQYQWLEAQLGLPISDAIAQKLADIALQNM